MYNQAVVLVNSTPQTLKQRQPEGVIRNRLAIFPLITYTYQINQ